MKKVNISIIFITLLFSFITIFGELDKGVVVVLKDASIIITLLAPFIVNKIFNRKLSDGFIFVWLIFIFMAHYLGVIYEGYNKWAIYDKVTHTISGVLTAYVSLLFIPERSEKLWFNVLFIIAFSWMCAGLWETFEFVCDTFFNGDAQRVAATGVTDTMTDMLVAFAGASVFSFGYYIKNKCKK